MHALSRPLAETPRETTVVVGLVSASHVVNHMYLVLLPPVLAVLATEFDVSLAALGFAIGVQAFVNTVCQLPYGYLSDNYDRTLSMALCLGFGALGVLVVATAGTFEQVLAGQAILGLGVAGHHPAHFPLIADATLERHRGRAFSVHGFAGNLGFAVPPVLITAVTAVSGLTWRHAFGLVGAVGLAFGVAAVAVLWWGVDVGVRRPNRESGDDGRSLGTRLSDGVRSILRSPGILALGLFALIASTTMWGVTSYVVVLLTQGYGVGMDLANLVLSATFVVGAGFILLGGDLVDRFSPGMVLVGSYLLVAVFVFVLSSMVVPPLVAVACALVGGSVGSMSLPARDKLADAFSARGDLGKNFAIITVGIMVGNTVAPPVVGTLIETSGLRVAFAAISLVALVGVALVVVVLRRVNPERTSTPEASRQGQ